MGSELPQDLDSNINQQKPLWLVQAKEVAQETAEFSYLLLLSELHLHLFVARLVLADAVTCDEVATDVGQLWVLLPCLLDKPDTHK